MGDVAELHRYEYPVTAVQFDSRKVVACVGENGVEVSADVRTALCVIR